MRLSRFYLPGTKLLKDSNVSIVGPVAHYMTQVLRLTTGSSTILFNGQGGEYNAIITCVSKKEIVVNITEYSDSNVESRLKINLVQAVSRGERMDYTLQKATELGVTEITPVITSRTVVNLKGDRADKRVSHWQKVVNGACEQSGRNSVPQVQPIKKFNDWLSENTGIANNVANSITNTAVKLLLHPDAEQSFRSFVTKLPVDCLTVTLLIGPEGGISQQEHEMAMLAGFKMLHLGPRVLRTETAAVVAISILQSNLGDLC